MVFNRKTLIFPVFNDIEKLGVYNGIIPDDVDVIIYEKNNKISEWEIRTIHDSPKYKHICIPSFGEQHFSLVVHILYNYKTMQKGDCIFFSKTHWIPQFSEPVLFNKELSITESGYSQNANLVRKFVFIYPDMQKLGHKHAAEALCQSTVVNQDGECSECKNNLKCFKCGIYYLNGLHNIQFSTSHIREEDYGMKLMKHIFPDYDPITKYEPEYCDSSYIIPTDLILYHKIELYEKLLGILKQNIMCHDALVNFFHIFWKETNYRMTKNASDSINLKS